MNGGTAFALDARLAADSHPLADWPLCEVRLHRDARWPWLLLIPRRPGLTELLELDDGQRIQLYAELDRAAAWVRAQPSVHKLNIAALGNVVAQLHVHLIGRHAGDAAWPRPVWGTPEPADYSPIALARIQSHFAPR